MTTTSYQIQRKALEKAQEKYQNLSEEEIGKNANMSSVKWSNPGHFPKAQGKFIFSLLCTLFFYIFLTPNNYKLSL